MWPSSSARRSVGGGVGVLEHRVHQRAERRAHRQVGHRRAAPPAVSRSPRSARTRPARSGVADLGRVLGLRQRLGPGAGVAVGGAGGRQRGVGRAAPVGVDRAREAPAPRAVGRQWLQRRRVGGVERGELERAGRRPPATRPRISPSSLLGDQRLLVRHGGLPGRRPKSIRCSGEAGGVALGRGVPRDHLRLGAGERDVEQPQRLPGVLAPVRATAWRCERAGAADVAAPPALVVVEERDLRVVADVAVPQRREVDDGVLQALAAVDRHQLHGGGVGVEAAGALGGDLELVVGDLRAQPAQQRRRRRAARRRSPGAAPRRCGAGRSAVRSPPTRPSTRAVSPPTTAISSTAATPRAARTSASVRTRSASASVSVVAAGVELGRGAAEEGGQRRGPHPVGAVGLLERLEQGQPLVGGRGVEDRAAGVDDRRHADREQRLLGRLELAAPGGQHRDVAGHQRPARRRSRRSEQPLDVVGEVGDDVLAPQWPPRASPRTRRARCGVRPAAGTAPPAPVSRDSWWCASTGCTAIRSSPSAAPLEQRLEPVEQRLVAAPVDAQRLAGAWRSSAAAR